MSQTEGLSALHSVDSLHVVVTLSLFLVNVLLTYLISNDGLVVRFSHVGHEMVYMSAAIVASHLFTASASNRVVPAIAVFPFLALWLFNLALTRRVFELGRRTLHPLTGVTILVGVFSVFAALAGLVEAILLKYFPHPA